MHTYPTLYSNSNNYDYKVYKKRKPFIISGVGLSFNKAFEEGLLEGLKQIKE